MDIILLSDILLAAIALIWLLVATIQDLNKREVANWLSFSLIIIALSVRAAASVISLKASYFLWGIALTIIFFGLANILYYLRIFAGGDAKLLTAIGAAFATKPIFVPLLLYNTTEIFPVSLPFLLIFILNTFFVGSVYGVAFSIVLASKNFKSFSNEFKKLNKKYKKQTFLFIFAALLLFGINKWFILYEFSVNILAILLLIFPFLFTFIKAVENSSMIVSVKPSELTEGDWIVEKIKIGKKVILPRFEGLSKEEIEVIKKSREKITIKHGIPFVPVFLIALITSFFVNILELLAGFFL